jgi:hypothetical protein
MIAIKIQCGCGQRYAFDVEPVGGRMPYTVTCPVCGADGTAAADAVIAQSQPAVVAAPAAQPMIGAAGAGRRQASRSAVLGQLDRSRLEAEARAKMLWGDSRQEVVKFVMMQGLPRDEALAFVETLMRERVAALRGIGIRKIIIGCCLVAVPVVAWFGFESAGVLPVQAFALLVMLGLYGLYLAFRGCFMVFLPKMEPGGVADK